MGERIELLLDASAAAGPVARERAEELVRLVVELYGEGLERLLELVHEAGTLDDALLDALAGDELVSSLLLVHGLHPYGTTERIERALDALRDSLGHEIRLISVSDDGVVTVMQEGEAHGCGSSASGLQQTLEDAITAVAPEVTVVQLQELPRAPAVIPVATLSARLRAGSTT